MAHAKEQSITDNACPRIYNSVSTTRALLGNVSTVACQISQPHLLTPNSFESTNHFSILHDKSITSPGPPHATFPPLRTSHQKNSQYKSGNTRLRFLNLNVQSIKNKKPELDEIIHSSKPDIILGTETWLDPSIPSHEYFLTDDYVVYRKDRNTRNQSHGGVLIAISSSILSAEVPELQTDCENIWAEVNISNARKPVIGCYYRPPSDDESLNITQPVE